MLELGRKQVALFQSDNVVYCEVLITCAKPRDILVTNYKRLVIEGKIVPIEAMSLPEKEAAWSFAKAIAKGRLDINGRIEVVQALLTIEYFLHL